MKRRSKTILAVVASIALLAIIWAMSVDDSFVNTFRKGGFDREQAIRLDIEREVPRRTTNPISPTRRADENETAVLEPTTDELESESATGEVEYDLDRPRQGHTSTPNVDRDSENLPEPATEVDDAENDR